MYVNPDTFTHNPNNDEYFRNKAHSSSKEIMMWGEMLGSAVCDNHEKMVKEIKKAGLGTSYDLKVHEDVLDAYNKFLDKWGFRKVFKTPEVISEYR